MSKSQSKRRVAAPKPPSLPVEIATAVKAAGFTDFFVIATGANARQVRAIAEAVQESLLAMRVKPSHTEGSKSTGWILLDYFDFVVHVFSAETRAFYGLERLWGSADSIDLTALVEPATARPA